MTGTFTENIKRMMGWCPQKDFDFTHLDNMNKTNMNAIYSQNKVPEYDRDRVKILVDSSRDAGIISILMPATIIFFIFFIFMTIRNKYSIIDIIPISIYYFALIILFLQNKTYVEFAHDCIIIHRPLLRPITIQRNAVLKTEIIKNSMYRMRWFFLPLAFFALLLIIRHNLIAIYLNIMKSSPLIVKVIDVYSMPMTSLLLFVISYHYLVRSYNPTFLKITTKNREVTFYTNNLQELKSELEVVQ